MSDATTEPTSKPPPWRRYEVGGAVRDALLGLPVTDRDWVVVGARAEDLIAAGFQPVGRDFPVFLHPVTHDEHALARTERKTAPGYHGFVFHAAPDVTLEQDLARRDLTINAMARDEQGVVIDPWGGQRDLQRRVLRHVSPAFAEDPVRILRLARFAARLPGFTVAESTLALMRDMVAAGEVDALVPERVWQEVARGLMEARPSRLLEVLESCGALERLWPGSLRAHRGGVAHATKSGSDALPALPGLPPGAPLHAALDAAAEAAAPLAVRLALCATAWIGAGASPDADDAALARARELAEHWRLPVEVRDRAALLVGQVVCDRGRRLRSALEPIDEGTAPVWVDALSEWDAWRRPERVGDLMQALRLGWPGPAIDALAARWQRALEVAGGIDTAQAAARAARAGARGPAIGEAVRQARAEALGAEAALRQPLPPAHRPDG